MFQMHLFLSRMQCAHYNCDTVLSYNENKNNFHNSTCEKLLRTFPFPCSTQQWLYIIGLSYKWNIASTASRQKFVVEQNVFIWKAVEPKYDVSELEIII